MAEEERSGPSGTLVVDGPTEPAPAPASGGTLLVEAPTEPAPLPGVSAPAPAEVADAAVTPEPPGRYTGGVPLGEGGMGVVWSVFDQHLQRSIALKQLRLPGQPGSSAGSTSRTPAAQRFLREARVTGSLEHPAIPPVYELGQRADGSLYYTMRIFAGRTLQQALAGCDLQHRLALLPNYLAVASAVAHAHRHSVIHRDLKPANVMLGELGETVVLDWGLAKVKGERDVQASALASELERLRDSSSLKTMAGTAMGTPSYMPPEQARGAVDEIDESSDVYALGAILYELLTGRPPHVGTSGYDIVKKVLKEPIVPVLEREPRAPRELAAVAERALAHDRLERYPDAGALASDVQAFLTGELVGAHRYRARERLWRWVRRRRWVLAGVAAMVAALVAAAFYRVHVRREAALVAEQARQVRVLAAVDAVLAGAEAGENDRFALDSRAFQLVGLREPLTEARVVAALSHPNVAVRRVAARSLGAMKSALAVDPLAGRLAEGVESDEDVLIELIVALGMIGDSRAEGPVAAARKRLGSNGTVWKSTESAYRMIPLAPLAPGVEISAEDWSTRGLAHLNKRNPRAALEHFEKAILLDPKLQKAYNNRAIARRRLGDEVGALADFQKAIELDPTAHQAHYNLALVKRSLGQHRSALGDLDRIVDAGKLGGQPLRARAQTRGLLGDAEGALGDVARARQLEPKNSLNETAEAELWAERDEWDKVIASTYRALELNPGHVFAIVLRATARRHKQDFAGALADLDRALLLEPNNPDARAGRASTLIAKGDGALGRGDVDALVQAEPKDGMSWMFRAVYHHAELGDWRAAESDLVRATELAGKTTKGVEYAIAAAFVVARQDLARAKERVEALAPDDGPHLTMRLARLLKARGGSEDVSEWALSRRDRCSAALALGLAAELGGDSALARRKYEDGARQARLDESPCILVRLGVKALAKQ